MHPGINSIVNGYGEVSQNSFKRFLSTLSTNRKAFFQNKCDGLFSMHKCAKRHFKNKGNTCKSVF